MGIHKGCSTERSAGEWADDGGRAEELVQAKAAADDGPACLDDDDARVAKADAAHRGERR